MLMCRIQESQLLPAYFLIYFLLIVSAAMLSILNTARIIFMKIYGSVEAVVTMCSVYKIWWLSCSYHSPPPPPPKKKKRKKNPGFGFFVKIHLLESTKLYLYFRSYSLMILFLGNVRGRVNKQIITETSLSHFRWTETVTIFMPCFNTCFIREYKIAR